MTTNRSRRVTEVLEELDLGDAPDDVIDVVGRRNKASRVRQQSRAKKNLRRKPRRHRNKDDADYDEWE